MVISKDYRLRYISLPSLNSTGDYMPDVCPICLNIIDQDEIYTLNKDLINAINTGALEEFSELEDAMYHGMYCAACCKQFINEEQ